MGMAGKDLTPEELRLLFTEGLQRVVGTLG